jgi:hypothetical protein
MTLLLTLTLLLLVLNHCVTGHLLLLLLLRQLGQSCC